MVCKATSLLWARIRLPVLFLGIFFVFGLFSRSAYAVRVVYYSATGHSELAPLSLDRFSIYDPSAPLSTGPSPYKAKCYITITNSSNQIQTVSATLTTSVTGSLNGPITSAANLDVPSTVLSVPIANVDVNPNSRIVMSATFQALPYLSTGADQDITCSGKITVTDKDPSLPGFVTANGLLITWMQTSTPQSKTGGFTRRVQVNIINTPFVIGEGRAF